MTDKHSLRQKLIAQRLSLSPAEVSLYSKQILGFDTLGFGLGYGRGFHDKFLEHQVNAITVGLAYDWSRIEPKLPSEPYDIPMKFIVTESRVYSF